MSITPNETSYLWQQACLILKTKLSPAVYNTWVLSNPVTKITEGESGFDVEISCQTAFHATNLKRNLDKEISLALEGVLKKSVLIKYVIGTGTQNRKTAVDGVDKKEVSAPLFSQDLLRESEQQRVQWRAYKAGLNPQFSFTTFAVSSSNEMAHAAAISVAKTPGLAYNPLFLYGEVGVGKTHLMHAIGNEIVNNDKNNSVIYCTGEDFTNEIVQAIQTKKAAGFKYKFRSTNVLLLDDIQFIAGKNAVQEEFFHTFNALVKQSAQIVLTSDRPPGEISLLEKRLRSRFEAGLMIDIGKPTFELRTAILLLKAKQAQLELDIELARVVAEKVVTAREIEGFVKRLRSEVELKNKSVTSELVLGLIEKNQKRTRRPLINPGKAIELIAKNFQVKQTEIKGKSRVKHLVEARHIAMYILNKDLMLPLTEVGRWFSHRDHTSVLHAVNKIQEQILDDELIKKEVGQIRSRLSIVEN